MENKEQLKSYIERFLELNEQKKAVQTDINELFKEIKGNGYDLKSFKIVLKKANMKKSERQEQDFLVDKYSELLGLNDEE